MTTYRDVIDAEEERFAEEAAESKALQRPVVTPK